MYHGVRAGGGAWWPTRYRWAYGWPYGRGYAPLTEDELQRIDDILAELQAVEPAPKRPESQ